MTTFSYLQKKIIFLMLCFFSLQAFYFLEAVGEGFAMIGTLEKALKLQVKKNKEQEQDFKQKIAVADSEIARLKISFQEKSAELDQSLEKNKSLSAENSLLSQSVAEEKAKIISLEREKQATQAQISALTSKNKQLLSQLDSLQKERSNDAKIFENLKAVKTRLDDMNVGFTEFSSLSLGIEQVVSSAEDLEKSYEEKNQDLLNLINSVALSSSLKEKEPDFKDKDAELAKEVLRSKGFEVSLAEKTAELEKIQRDFLQIQADLLKAEKLKEEMIGNLPDNSKVLEQNNVLKESLSAAESKVSDMHSGIKMIHGLLQNISLSDFPEYDNGRLKKPLFELFEKLRLGQETIEEYRLASVLGSLSSASDSNPSDSNLDAMNKLTSDLQVEKESVVRLKKDKALMTRQLTALFQQVQGFDFNFKSLNFQPLLISLGDVLTKSKVQTNELLDLGIEKHIITRGLQQLMFSLRSLSNKSFIDDFDYSQFSQMIDVLLRELSFLRRRLASDLAYESSKNLKGIKDRETQIKDLLSKTEAENHKARESFSVILGLGNQIA